MYYGNLKKCDIANGIGVRVTLFVSGCTNHCPDCFQPQTWDFDYGKPFTDETKAEIFAELDKMVDLVFEQLLERLEIQPCKKCKNYPFLMGQGIWIDSERLGPDDEVREVLKHGTLTVGFIGLAECLKALIGKHHGESEEAQELGLKIVGFIREKADKKAAETKLNFSVIATPAEGLSGKFVRLDRKRFGSIEGITDKDYYTNSFHIPVYYSISAYNKIRLEAPYHAMTNGGHITYVEVDGDPVNNLEAFEDLIRAMKDMGVGYGSINHPVDRDPLCGYKTKHDNTRSAKYR